MGGYAPAQSSLDLAGRAEAGRAALAPRQQPQLLLEAGGWVSIPEGRGGGAGLAGRDEEPQEERSDATATPRIEHRGQA